MLFSNGSIFTSVLLNICFPIKKIIQKSKAHIFQKIILLYQCKLRRTSFSIVGFHNVESQLVDFLLMKLYADLNSGQSSCTKILPIIVPVLSRTKRVVHRCANITQQKPCFVGCTGRHSAVAMTRPKQRDDHTWPLTCIKGRKVKIKVVDHLLPHDRLMHAKLFTNAKQTLVCGNDFQTKKDLIHLFWSVPHNMIFSLS